MEASRLSDTDLLNLDEAAVRRAVRDPEMAAWIVLRLQALVRLAEDGEETEGGAGACEANLSTPSSALPAYAKPNGQGGGKPGRPEGHEGSRRPLPRIDRREEHVLERCPDCGGKVHRNGVRTRTIEELEETRATATEHVIHRYFCKKCRKRVEPKVEDALPNAAIGIRTVALTAWLHYGLGTTVSQIQEVLSRLFRLRISGGGLTQQWKLLGEYLEPWYEEIRKSARESAVLHADETGWRVNGKTHWLWCFTAEELSCYVIDPSRGSRVPLEFLGETFAGTLVTDFFPAYDKLVVNRRQVCLVHLLRDLENTSKRNTSKGWTEFAAALKKFVQDAIRLATRPDRDGSAWRAERDGIERRLYDLFDDADMDDKDVFRIVKRLDRHEGSIFGFLDDLAVPPDNNRAEREVRPAVISRKNSFHNMSDAGASTQSILMSVHRTLRLRGLDPLATIVAAIRQFIRTGELPPLPEADSHDVANPAPPPDG